MASHQAGYVPDRRPICGGAKDRGSKDKDEFPFVFWNATIVRLLNEMVADIDNGQTVTVGKCAVRADGILLKNFFITWEDLSYQRNYNRLTINSNSRADIWTNLVYTETDNVHVLMQFLDRKFDNTQTNKISGSC